MNQLFNRLHVSGRIVSAQCRQYARKFRHGIFRRSLRHAEGDLTLDGRGGPALTGVICPLSGNDAGLPTADIGQTDELSGGATFTSVATLANSSPMEAETMYGTFTALAEASEGKPLVALSIATSEGGPAVFSASNVDTAAGTQVSGLEPNTYTATWTISSANGDTRTLTTRFMEQAALQGAHGNREPKGIPGAPGASGVTGPTGARGPAGPKPTVSCKLTGKIHHKIQCKVKFPTTTPASCSSLSAAGPTSPHSDAGS